MIRIFLVLSLFQVSLYCGFEEDVQKYCGKCHGRKKAEAGINVYKLTEELPLVKNHKVWKSIIHAMKDKSMPPDDARDLPDRTRKSLLSTLKKKVTDFDYSKVKNPGYTASRRLTVEEFKNSMADLLGINLKLNTVFPSDMKPADGFKNNVKVLFFQRPHLQKFSAAVDEYMDQLTKKSNEKQLSRLGFGDYKLTSDNLKSFASRAWRRPAKDDELKPFLKLYKEEGSKKKALIKSLKAVLMSPQFIMKQPLKDQALKPYKLAERLSYFLWSSLPDKTLYNKAKDGSILKSSVLRSDSSRL